MVRFKLALAVLAALIAGVPHGQHARTASPGAAAAAPSSEAIAVNGSPPLIPPAPLVLTGEVLGLPQGATLSQVRVSLAGHSYPASVSGSTYRAEIPSGFVGAMVVVDANAGSNVKLRGFVGSAGRLSRLAGSDGIATSAEVPGLRVNAWTSAAAVVLQARLGREPISDTEIEHGLTRVRMQDIGAIAYLLDGYATGARPLPPGYAAGLDVATNPSALAAALQPVTNGSNFWNATTRVFAQALPTLAPVANVQEIPSSMLARSELPDDLPQSPETYLLSRRADGRYDFLGAAAAEVTFRQGVSAGALLLVPDGIVRYRLRETRPFSPSAPTDIERTLDSVEWRRMHDGEQVDAWILVWNWVERYPAFPGQAPQSARTSTGVTTTDFASLVNRTAWAALAGQRRTFPVTCFKTVESMPQLQVCDTAVHRFDAGGGGVTEDVGLKVDTYMRPRAGTYGTPFQWRVQDDGSLVIETPDSRTVAWATQSAAGVDSIVYYTWKISADATQSFMGTTLSVVAETVPFGASQAVGSWGSGFIQSAAFEYPVSGALLQLVRNADGYGENVSNTTAQPVRTPSKWSIQGERIWELRSRARMANGTTQYVLDCETAFNAGASACSPFQYRYFRPLRRIGNRLYGIEEIHLQPTIQPRGYPGTYDVTVTTRANYQVCMSGGCLAYGAAAAPAGALETAAGAPTFGAARSAAGERHAHLRLRMRRLRP